MLAKKIIKSYDVAFSAKICSLAIQTYNIHRSRSMICDLSIYGDSLLV